MADNKNSKEPNSNPNPNPNSDPAPKRKPPADAQKFGRAEYEALRYKDKGKINSSGVLKVNPKSTGAARHLYNGVWLSVEYVLSKTAVIMFLLLRGKKDEDNDDSIEVRFDKKTGNTCTIALGKPLRGLGIEIPKGRKCIAPLTVEDVEGYGPCIVLELKEPDFVATRPTGKKDEDEENGQKGEQKTEQKSEHNNKLEQNNKTEHNNKTDAAAAEADPPEEQQ